MKTKTDLKAGTDPFSIFNSIRQINAFNTEVLSRNNVSVVSVGDTSQNSGQIASIG